MSLDSEIAVMYNNIVTIQYFNIFFEKIVKRHIYFRDTHFRRTGIGNLII